MAAPPELAALERVPAARASAVARALGEFWPRWRRQPQMATLVLRRLLERRRTRLAMLVLEQMRQNEVETNIYHWNPIIYTFSQSSWQEGFHKLTLAEAWSALPDVKSHTSVLTAQSRAKAWQSALLAKFQKPQVRLHNVVLGSCTAWVHVMQLLAGMCTVALLPDAFSYSAGTTWNFALLLAKDARCSAVELDITNFGAIIGSACATRNESHRSHASHGSWRAGLAWMDLAERDGLRLSRPAMNAAMEGRWRAAAAFLAKSPPPNEVSFTSAMSACQEAWEAALDMFTKFCVVQCELNTFVCNTATSALGGSGWRAPYLMLRQMQVATVEADSVSFSLTGGFHDDWRLSVSTFAAGQDRSLPSRCTKLPWRHALLAEQEAAAEAWPLAALLLARSVSRRVGSAAALHRVAEAETKASLWQRALYATQTMQRTNLETSNILYSSIIGSVDWAAGVSLMDSMRDAGLEVNSYICSATLKTLGPARQWAKSLELLKGNQAVTSFCLSAALPAFDRSLWRRGLAVATDATDAAGRSSAAQICGEGGQWRWAGRLLEGIPMDAVSFTSALSARACGGWRSSLALLKMAQ
ncbi:unnamed protein product, partial [Effrenium voratum]